MGLLYILQLATFMNSMTLHAFIAGKVYTKIGHGPQFETTCNTKEEVLLWFRNGPSQAIKDSLTKLLLKVFPGECSWLFVMLLIC